MNAGYRAIADALRTEIDAGRLPPGSKLPSENELMAAYEVEQPTARRALEVLKNEGLIVARRGAGTFVREFRLYRRSSPARLAESGWGAGRSVWQSDDAKRDTRVDGIEVTVADAPDHVAAVLDLRAGEKVVVRRRRYLVDDAPVQFATSYYPAPLVRDTRIAEADTGGGGVYARLAEVGHKPVHFREELRARMPREAEAKVLDLTQGTPVIVVVRTAYTAEGRAVEVNEMTLDASAYILEYAFSSEESS
ncbi:GntR family transcriptional regulator [Actinophytocola sp.]|uniref:GntR family transcriptional regulator n=1 Tax=Actinophytocola sp. TaxID=1872138 RepID=UPI00389A0C71